MLSFLRLGRKSEIKDFAVDLADQIAKRYPPALDSQPGKRPSVNRLTRITEEACVKAVEFHDHHKLGWLSRARLGNDFRWALKELGYTKEFVDFATEAVIVHISRKR
ncbi:hypothetical protein [Polaromonas sp.]|uniref:hypothetical protein n=1 Tax=Polaromonas sp. TaxID=1869339 RepID=UPI003751F4C6